MTLNHPNRRRLPWRVRYGEHEAAFSDRDEAQRFARWLTSVRLRTAEVTLTHGDGRGIVSRWEHGRMVPDGR